jgi:hypothetical protein
MMNPHEEAFVVPSRQERFLVFLSKPKNRRKFTAELAHRYTGFLQLRFLRSIPPKQQNPSDIYALLKRMGPQERCWVVSEGSLDAQEIALLEALNEVVGRGFGTIISCVPGRLAYFESEDERYILYK